MIVRLFIGLPLPSEAHEVAAGELRRLRQRGWPVRWVGDEGLHLTLKFFGEVTSDRMDTIAEMLSFAGQGMRPMPMTLGGAGVFPGPERPRVIKLDVEADSELELLQDRIERGGEQIGFPPEGRPFHPHITLGRVREGHRLPPDWSQVLQTVGGGTTFLADRVVLYESRLSPSGPTYTVRQELRLE